MKIFILATVVALGATGTLAAQDISTPTKTKPCPKGKTCAAPQPPAQNDSAPSSSMQGADADVPDGSSTPSTPPPSPRPATPSSSAPAPNGFPDMPTGGHEPDPPSSSSSSPSDSSRPAAGDSGFSSSKDHSGEDEPAPTTEGDDSPIKAMPLKDLGSSGSSSEARKKLEASRVPDDLKVAKFYSNDGNWAGAYLRYKDAVEHEADNEDAQWGYAVSADKLKKTDEAREHYSEYLRVAPDGDHAKAAERALAKLGPAPPKTASKTESSQ